MASFDLLDSNIIDLQLKLVGKLPINRDELLALVNSHGRDDYFFTKDKDGNGILIDECKVNKKYELSNLDVSNITNFDDIFKQSNFNGDINSWNVSKATSMNSMFAYTKNFNSTLNSWDISKVTSLEGIFYEAKSFNQPLNSWNTSNVSNMAYMFAYTKEFNQPLNSWNTSKVINMNNMFYYTKEFNQNLNYWDISSVTNINSMFESAIAFNQPVLWDLSYIEKCYEMFYEAKAFETRFNDGNSFCFDRRYIKEFLTKKIHLMEAIHIEENKSKDLDNFLLNLKDNFEENKIK